ncbi:MAG: hypothetical protein Faunusvirus13_12 [Faunusvirus sp.]|jgi:hypothetical protein|uniref:Ankyrin repeat protein n=1 Tax=Faunusvirus sp. TaxID=2487766 RepID=A0A3G5A1P3_9VIRU|nr:MAG: hypothetical protein Faunusvirus13_12 [Faunusvirus sp.]
MSSAEAHRDEFIKLLKTQSEDKCIEYINKYNDFYDTIYANQGDENMLMYTCHRGLSRVAIALIDKKCDLTYQVGCGYTSLIYASLYLLYKVVAHIIDNSQDTITRCSKIGRQCSEMMFLCRDSNNNSSLIKMIDKGYDIYYQTSYDKESLITEAIEYENVDIIKKLIDIDTDFAKIFNIYYKKYKIKNYKYDAIVKYINDRHNAYKHEIIATMNDAIVKYINDRHNAFKHEIIAIMNDASPTNMLYQSFHTTYAVQLVDVICDYILLPI